MSKIYYNPNIALGSEFENLSSSFISGPHASHAALRSFLAKEIASDPQKLHGLIHVAFNRESGKRDIGAVTDIFYESITRHKLELDFSIMTYWPEDAAYAVVSAVSKLWFSEFIFYSRRAPQWLILFMQGVQASGNKSVQEAYKEVEQDHQ